MKPSVLNKILNVVLSANMLSKQYMLVPVKSKYAKKNMKEDSICEAFLLERKKQIN